MALLLPGVVLRGWGGVMDGINGARENGYIRVSQPSRLSIAIETGEHAHLLSPCFLRARERHSTVAPFRLGQASGDAQHLFFAR